MDKYMINVALIETYLYNYSWNAMPNFIDQEQYNILIYDTMIIHIIEVVITMVDVGNDAKWIDDHI